MKRGTSLIVATALVAGLVHAVAGAAVSTCPYDADRVAPPAQDPRLSKHSLSIDGGTYRFDVLLPPGYDAPGNLQRYPVLYLMPGGFFNEDTWFSHAGLARAMNVIAFTGAQPADRQAILVSPDDHDLGAYYDWNDGTQRWETFHVKRLIPWIDSHYRTIADRGHRSMVGISGGGLAIGYAARYPELYGVAGALSGAVNPTMDQEWFWIPISAAASGESQACPGPNGRARQPFALYGNPVTQDIHAHEHDPTDLAPNLGATAIFSRVGTGVPCDPTRDLRDAWNPLWHVEPIAHRMTVNFDAALTRAGVAHEATFLPCGVHSFPYWSEGFRIFWNFMWANIGRGAPAAFDHRSAAGSFAVWGWTVSADPARAREFLDLTDASCAGVTLTGSGTTAVTTGPCFTPGSAVALTGAVEPQALADAAGRVAFHVDLGPAHTFQQYTAPERALEAAGHYFVTKSIVFG